MAAYYGYVSQFGVDTVSTVTKRYDFESCGVAVDETFLDMNGLRGTRERAIERVRAGNRHIGGSITLQPTSLELSYLLPWILGNLASGSTTQTFALADTLLTRWVVVDKGAKVMTYNGCVVDKATIRGSQGEPLTVSLDISGQDESIGNAGTFPSLTLDITTVPFIFTDAVISINSTTVQSRDIEITIDNVVDKDRFFNSQTATALIAMDRHIGLTVNLPYGDAAALYGLGAGGATSVITFTAGNQVLTFTMVKVAFPRKPIAVPGRSEIMLPYPGEAHKSGTTLSLVTTLIPGP